MATNRMLRSRYSARLGFAAAVVLGSMLIVAGAGISAQSKSEWTASVVPKAQCGPGEPAESGLQGQTTSAERFSGASAKGFRCNLELVIGFQGEGGNMDFAAIGNCGYLSTAATPEQKHPGTWVVDASDRRNPKVTAYLDSPAMLKPLENLDAHPGRKLVAAFQSQVAPPGHQTKPSVFELYDATDCAHPVLKSTVTIPNFTGHAGRFTKDGRTHYTTSATYNGAPVGEDGFVAIDVSDPAKARLLYHWTLDPADKDIDAAPHDIAISDDGNRVYLGVLGVPIPEAAKAQNRRPFNGLAIVDVSDIQRRKPNPQVRVISKLFWKDGGGGQVPLPLKIKGRPYIIYEDFFGAGGGVSDGAKVACSQGLPPFGFLRLIDISDEKNPKVASKILLQVHDPANCAQILSDLTTPRNGYSSMICTPDNPQDAALLACAMRESGLRVFDVRNPSRPAEVAYYKPPAKGKQIVPGSGFAGSGPDHTTDTAIQVPRFDKAKNEIWFMSQDNGMQIVRFTDRFMKARADLFGKR